MKMYLKCLRSKRGVNEDECRQLSKSYLKCRMDRYCVAQNMLSCSTANDKTRNLMAPDSMKNLGFGEDPSADSTPAGASNGEAGKNEQKNSK